MKRKIFSVLFVLVALSFSLVTVAPPAYAAAALSYIGDIGTAQSKNPGTTLAVTTTAAVAAGDDIIVTFAMDVAAGAVSVADSAGNSYTSVADVTNDTGGPGSHVRTLIFAAYHVTALSFGSTITITHPSVTARAAGISVFRGLAPSGALDKTRTGTGYSTTPSSGATAATTQDDELLIGGVGTEGPYGDLAGLWQGSFTAGPRLGTTGGTDGTNITVSMGYKIVLATGAYTASKSGISGSYWAAAIATFKRDNTAPTVTINQAAAQSDPTSASPINFTVVFSERVIGFATGDVIPSGTAGATTATVSEIAPNNGTTYNVAVSGMTGPGTVITTIAAGVATDVAGNDNTASTSTDNTVTYTPATSLAVTAATGTYGGTVDLTATLTSGGSGVSGKTITFSLNGTPVSPTTTTNGNGIATLTSVSLSGINAGTYATGVGASFAGDADYLSSSGTASLTVNPKALTVSGITASNREYNGTTNASLIINSPSLGGVVGSDNVTLDTSGAVGTFDNKNVGTGKTVTISGLTLGGADAGNYTLTHTTTANITDKTLTVTGITAPDKTYDGTTTATLTIGSPSLVGVVGGDTVNLNIGGATGTFDNKNVGTGKTVSVSGLTLGGADAGNYTLIQPTTTANITPKPITVTPDSGQSKVYGAPDPILTYTCSPALVGGDSFTGALSRDPGEAVGTYNIIQDTLALSSNYALTYVVATFTINPPGAPTIGSFTPTSGGTGTTVTITGTNFIGVTAVSFGGTDASSFTIDSATQITAVVGSGSTGAVSVTTLGGTATSAGTFTFSGGGGGGGGGATSPSLTPVTLRQLTTTTSLALDANGIVHATARLKTSGGETSLYIAAGTKLLDARGKPLTSLSASAVTSPPAPPSDRAIVLAYDFGSDGATFTPAITLTMSYDPAALPEWVSETELYIAYWDGSHWVALDTTVDTNTHTLSAGISHFTPFAVLAKLAPPPPAYFEVRNLDISPRQLKVGEDVTISAYLANIGGMSGEYTLIMKVEGLPEESQVIELAPGQSREVSFTVTPGSPGSYRVEIGGLQDSFMVAPLPPAAEAGGFKWLTPWSISVIVAMVLAALAFTIARKRLQPVPVAGEPLSSKPVSAPSLVRKAMAAIAGLTSTLVRKRPRPTGIFEAPSEPIPTAVEELGEPAPVPSRVRNLEIIPNRVKPGKIVNVFAEVTNTGPTTSSFSLVLKVRDIVEAVKEITLGPGQSQKVVFMVLRDEPGVYDLDLEGLKGSFIISSGITTY